MHALVFWIKSKTTSVVNIKDLVPDKEEGEITLARYQSNSRLYYKAKIIRKSGKFFNVMFLCAEVFPGRDSRTRNVNAKICKLQISYEKRKPSRYSRTFFKEIIIFETDDFFSHVSLF